MINATDDVLDISFQGKCHQLLELGNVQFKLTFKLKL